jgi:hypothetical protein
MVASDREVRRVPINLIDFFILKRILLSKSDLGARFVCQNGNHEHLRCHRNLINLILNDFPQRLPVARKRGQATRGIQSLGLPPRGTAHPQKNRIVVRHHPFRTSGA